MNEIIWLLTTHGYWLLFLCVLGRQACLPIPANLFVLAAGALAGFGKLSVIGVVAFSVAAFVVADLAWYEVGKRHGGKVLHFIRKAMRNQHFEPDRLAEVFARHGVKVLLFSKFMLGLDALAAPASGYYRIKPSSFLLFDALGAALWTSVYAALGYIFRAQVNSVAAYSKQIGVAMVWAGVALLGVLVIRRLLRHYRLLRACQISQLTADQLACKLVAGEVLVILDLQRCAQNDQWPIAVPGAIRCDRHQFDQLADRYRRLNSETKQAIVIYCSSPDEHMSVCAARRLKRNGCQHAWVLAGGLPAWRSSGFPVTRNVPVFESLEWNVYVLREVFQYSSERSAVLLDSTSDNVDEVLKRTRELLGAQKIAWPAMLEPCCVEKLQPVDQMNIHGGRCDAPAITAPQKTGGSAVREVLPDPSDSFIPSG
jgi:membrane protein DedA with SNARE-associated domain/rhodanese-related sulfurtransferase